MHMDVRGTKSIDLESKAVFITRDDVFHEDVFPFSSIDCNEPTCPLPLVTIGSEVTLQDQVESDVTTVTGHGVSSPPIQTFQPRRSTRTTSKPAWYKARLVAKGYNQVEGEDYTDTFAPVAKAVTVRLFQAVAVSKGLPIHHVDVKIMHSTMALSLKEDIYMDPPKGYEVVTGYACKLKKSLYGLKQASRQWNQKFR
ncbi:UNVERIFIED_CONTAM: Retrovirus-related Pol polyprotein from transposon RE1 [Sesamum latifolium]|uniref:Retrovirus-related Pol polyprotein from transposon RE1 n=1 Tax=Sesamum latifolium TaxID=2727402 RepID=A0AAW2W043_9LAMI